jgi:hypothetical protein
MPGRYSYNLNHISYDDNSNISMNIHTMATFEVKWMLFYVVPETKMTIPYGITPFSNSSPLGSTSPGHPAA